MERDFQAERIKRVMEKRKRRLSYGGIVGNERVEISDVRRCHDLMTRVFDSAVMNDDNLKGVADDLGLSVTSFNLACKYHYTSVPAIERVRLAISDGADNINIVCEKTGFSKRRVQSMGIFNSLVREYKTDVIQQVIDRGVDSIEELIDETGFCFQTIKRCCEREKIETGFDIYNVPWNRYWKPKRNPERDEDIKRGLSPLKLVKRWGISDQGVGGYIKKSGQEEVWLEARVSSKNQDMERKVLIGNMIGGVLDFIKNRDLNENEKWAFNKAQEYCSNSNKLKIHLFDHIFGLFKRRKYAESRGEKLSLKELGEEFGIGFTQVGKIFKRVNVEPMYGTQYRSQKKVLFQKKKRWFLQELILM